MIEEHISTHTTGSSMAAGRDPFSHEDQFPPYVGDRMTRVYAKTPHFQNHIVQWIPLVIGLLQFFQNCRKGENEAARRARLDDQIVRKIRKGKRFAKKTAQGVVRDQHQDIPPDQQEVLAANLVEEWSKAPESELREMVELSHQIVVD